VPSQPVETASGHMQRMALDDEGPLQHQCHPRNPARAGLDAASTIQIGRVSREPYIRESTADERKKKVPRYGVAGSKLLVEVDARPQLHN